MNKKDPDYDNMAIEILSHYQPTYNIEHVTTWLKRVYEMGVAAGKEEAWAKALANAKEWKVM